MFAVRIKGEAIDKIAWPKFIGSDRLTWPQIAILEDRKLNDAARDRLHRIEMGAAWANLDLVGEMNPVGGDATPRLIDQHDLSARH
jgi:hypothetical protein